MSHYFYPPHGVFKSVAPTASSPRTFPAVAIRVLRPFYATGRLLTVGETAKVPQPDADDAVAVGRAEFA